MYENRCQASEPAPLRKREDVPSSVESWMAYYEGERQTLAWESDGFKMGTTTLLDTKCNFRRLRGCRQMPELLAALDKVASRVMYVPFRPSPFNGTRDISVLQLVCF